uniref:Uncharacterized protein n=1 Tax=Ciona savignyi TaxID=51511 RepID=H2Z1F3_CIOSA
MAKPKRSKKQPPSKNAEAPAPKNDAASMSSDEDDWEEVEEKKLDLSISKKDVEIKFDLPNVVQKQRKKKTSQDWILAFVKRCMNKNIKDRQIAIHKVHLLCLLHVGFQLNKVGSSEELQALVLSLLTFKYIKQSTLTTVDRITSLVNWINSKFTSGNNRVTLKNNGMKDIPDKESHLQQCIENEKVEQKLDLVLLHLTMFRALGLQVRFVFSIQPLSFKPPKYPEVER